MTLFSFILVNKQLYYPPPSCFAHLRGKTHVRQPPEEPCVMPRIPFKHEVQSPHNHHACRNHDIQLHVESGTAIHRHNPHRHNHQVEAYLDERRKSMRHPHPYECVVQMLPVGLQRTVTVFYPRQHHPQRVGHRHTQYR